MNLSDIPLRDDAPTLIQVERIEKEESTSYFWTHMLLVAVYIAVVLTPVAWLCWRLLGGETDVYEIGIPVIICILLVVMTVAVIAMLKVALDGRREEPPFPKMHLLRTEPKSASVDTWQVHLPPTVGPLHERARRS